MVLKSDLIFEKLFGPADELLRVEGGVAELGMHDEPVGQQEGHPGDVLRVFPGAVVPFEQLLDDEVAELVVDVQHLAANVLIAETGGGQNIPVDVTPVKQVKKIPNGKPGMVIYHTYRTVIANPYADIVVDALNAEKKEN